ncbi:unnamed protein product [Rotaria sp. Silwood2]|nr:unnamed protein product [Rotaria sp. Silwood2]CAF4324011.1 unnamed protein product [Rotaria sp. Silwood2]
MHGILCDIILEIGYDFTSLIQHCQNALVHFGLQEFKPSTIGCILSGMITTYSGLNENTSIYRGQTGVDRSALDVAIELNYKYGGWCPRGRKAEDGIIDPIKYANLEETLSNNYPQRTEFNVRDSDGTLIIILGSNDTMGRGSKLTVHMTKKYEKPLLIINLNQEDNGENEAKVIEWLSTNKIKILNVAGPREETTPGIYKQAEQFLRSLLQKIKS